MMILSITLYPLPALAQMVVKEFSTIATVTVDEAVVGEQELRSRRAEAAGVIEAKADASIGKA